jgi:hypothetical protein
MSTKKKLQIELVPGDIVLGGPTLSARYADLILVISTDVGRNFMTILVNGTTQMKVYFAYDIYTIVDMKEEK